MCETEAAVVGLALKNLLRNRRRTLLTFLGVAVSTSLLGVLLSVYSAFYLRESYGEQAIRLITRHKVSYMIRLPEYYGDRIRAVPGVVEACIFDYYQGVWKDNKPEHMFPRSAVDADRVFKIRTESIVPPDQLEAFLHDRQGMAVGKSVADRVGLELGDRVALKGDLYPVDLELYVRAIYSGPDDIEAYFHREYLQESLPESLRGQAMSFSVRVAAPEDAPRVAREIDEMFRNAPMPTKTETEKAFFLAYISQIGNIKAFLLTIASAVVFTMLLVTGNAMAMSVRERTRETAVMRTLGFSRARVLELIAVEAAGTALAGGAAGAVLAQGVSHLMRNATVSFLQGFVMPAWGVAACLGAALAVGLAGALPSAVGAARLEVVAALRRTD
jgi:putative ABC transport system permease protein